MCGKEASTVPAVEHVFLANATVTGLGGWLRCKAACMQGITDELHMFMQVVTHQEGVLLCQSTNIVCEPRHFFVKNCTYVWKVGFCKHFTVTQMTKVRWASEDGSEVSHVEITKLLATRPWQTRSCQTVK